MKERNRFHGNLTYGGEYRDLELAILGTSLQGKPDTKGWRGVFEENKVKPVEHKGRIFPDWAVKDAQQLLAEDPGALNQALNLYGLTMDDIPPLRLE